MTVEQVANRLVELCREGKFSDAVNELYAKNIRSVEPRGAGEEVTNGFDNVAKKTQGFMEQMEQVNSLKISDPIVADNFFSVGFWMNAKLSSMPEAMQMDEVCVYHVLDGKIVEEQFFHTMPPQE